jgi:hypothetical protein
MKLVHAGPLPDVLGRIERTRHGAREIVDPSIVEAAPYQTFGSTSEYVWRLAADVDRSVGFASP